MNFTDIAFGSGAPNLAPGAGKYFGGGMGGTFGAPGGSGGFNWGSAGGMLSLANMALGRMGMSNTAQSYNRMQGLGGIMRDLDFSTNILAQNKDIFEQKDAPRWAAAFRVNDPGYRRYEVREMLKNPGLAGRYSAFVA